MSVGAMDRCVRRDDVQVRELEGEAFVYDPRTADTHRLNETAWFIWRQCDGRHDTRDIMREVTEHYDVARETASEHIERILGELQERNLVSRVMN